MRRINTFFLFVFLTIFCHQNISAKEFRIDNEVRAPSAPVVKSTTYLLDGNFFSLIGENGEATYFDVQKQVFTLVDPQLRAQTSLDASEMKKRVEALRRRITSDPKAEMNSFAYFAANPKFQMEAEAVSGALALQSPWIDYSLTTRTFPDEETVRQYFDFCDWTCYLNLRINPYASSMMVRLEVNRILREQQRFPSEITVSLFPKGKIGFMPKEEKIQSAHQLVVRLSDADKKRIDKVFEQMRTFPVVPYDEYTKRVAEKSK